MGAQTRRPWCEKHHFCDAIYIQNDSFYQDRLGTNIGKTQKRVVLFAAEL
jgi:hypothetical protein